MIRLETIASTRKPEIREIEKPTSFDEHKDHIIYQGRSFAVPSNIFGYLTNLPDNIAKANKLAVEGGMMCIEEDGHFGCGCCNFQKDNPIQKALNGAIAVFNVEGDPGIFVEGCTYSRNDLRYSARFTNRDSGEVVDAWKTPCVVYDSEVENLVVTGQINKFEIKPEAIPSLPYILQLDESPQIDGKDLSVEKQTRVKRNRGLTEKLKLILWNLTR